MFNNFLGNSAAVLKVNGRRKGLSNLYDSDKWEFPWNRERDTRSWKHNRLTKYRNPVATVKGLTLITD